MSGQSGGHRLCLSKLNEQLTCKLCGGYFIDATTIIECLHSFCRSCIVKYLENNKYCPICEVQVHKSRPLLNIRPDYTLQDIVYKLVPGCYQNEMRCRREFYLKHPEARNQAMSPEARGEPIESHIYSPDESLSLSLEYFNPNSKDATETNVIKEAVSKPLPRRYLRCPAAVTVFHLQKLIRAKYGLSDAHRVDIMYKEEPLCSNYTLMDVMYIYHWRRKVPLHLSYRIFETSPKRLKLSEDNPSYRKSLSNAGIDSIEPKSEQSLKREWKEVQLKISETGVMSVTDISSPESKRSTRIEGLKQEKNLETSITVETVNKSESLDKSDSDKSTEQKVQATLSVDTQFVNNPDILVDSGTPSIEISNSSKMENSASAPTTEQEVKSAKLPDTGTVTNCQQKPQETNDNVEINNTDVKSVLQIQASAQNQKTGESKTDTKSIEDTIVDKQQTTNINNNIPESKVESQKQNTKNLNETKNMNAGSKLDALSAKLQFQPKIGQINNTYSKKTSKEKRTIVHNLKKTDIKLTESSKTLEAKNQVETGNAKVRTTCGITPTKTPISCTVSIATQQKPITTISTPQSNVLVSLSTTYTTTPTVSISTRQEVSDKNTLDQRIVNSNVVEQRINSLEQPAMESVQKSSHSITTVMNQLQYVKSNNTPSSEALVSVSLSPSTSTVSQVTTTFPYTVQDLVSNTTLKSPTKSTAGCSVQKLVSGNTGNIGSTTVCGVTDSQACSVSQSNMQNTLMGIYSIPTSLKNSCTSQNTHTTSSTTRQTPSKSNFEITGVYSIPPCPDAIPISLMKPAVRKHEIIAKGTNLNEICAKIGTSGSKINDICAKIGENSKEKNKAETRNKPDIPDLLKISKKTSSPTSSETSVKHIPNIPNVPIYTPSNTTTENKTMFSNVKDNTKIPLPSPSTPLISTSHVQKTPSVKKQSQPVGYKTLRDPPKSWNPTLSKNNYVAAKNQAKEMQNQTQSLSSEGINKPIQSKPAKIFKMRNMPRYLGNPASGVKPMYGVSNETKEKEQSANSTKNTTLNMMKIDPKTLSPIVSTVNSPIVSPPPYSPNARSYQNTPFPRDICRNTGSPISPRNSPVNMLSTNPFIPSPTPNTNPRLIYSHFPPPFPDASRFPNPLIRSPIGIPPPSAFHSSLPPSINKLYRSSYIPQTTGYSPVSQPPTVQRIPPSTHSSSPKSPKTSSPISSSSYNQGKTEISTATSTESMHFSKSASQQEHNAFNLSKTGSLTNIAQDFPKTSSSESQELQESPKNFAPTCATTQNKQASNVAKSKQEVQAEDQKHKETEPQKDKEKTRGKEDNSPNGKTKGKTESECRRVETNDSTSQNEKKDKPVSKVNGDVTIEHFSNEKCKDTPQNERDVARPEEKEQPPAANKSVAQTNSTPEKTNDVQVELNSEDVAKTCEQIQGKKAETQRSKAES